MRIVLLLALSLVLLGAKPYKGFSSYAAMHPDFPCGRFMRISRAINKPAMAVLWGTFGSDRSCIKKFLREVEDKPHMLEIHFSNEAGRRNRRLGPGELFRGTNVTRYNKRLERMNLKTKNRIEKRLLKILNFVRDHKSPKTRVILTTGLEDNYSTKAYKRLYAVLRAGWPYEIARNPVREQAFIGPADYFEYHTLQPDFRGKACIANPDGVEPESVSAIRQFLSRYSHCRGVFLWTYSAQGLVGDFAPPRSRVFRITTQDIKIYRKLLR